MFRLQPNVCMYLENLPFEVMRSFGCGFCLRAVLERGALQRQQQGVARDAAHHRESQVGQSGGGDEGGGQGSVCARRRRSVC